MIADFAGCWLIEVTCKKLFAVLEPKEMITRGYERRYERGLAEITSQQESKKDQ